MKLNLGRLILIGIILLFVIGVIIAVANSGGSTKINSLPGIKVYTVQAEIGCANIKISNLNTGNSIIKVAADLPFSFNFTKGDTLKFTVTTLPDYTFNAWVFNTGTFDNHNPLTIKPDVNVVMSANILDKGELP